MLAVAPEDQYELYAIGTAQPFPTRTRVIKAVDGSCGR